MFKVENKLYYFCNRTTSNTIKDIIHVLVIEDEAHKPKATSYFMTTILSKHSEMKF